MSTNKIVWSLRELTSLIRQRQLNKYDANFGVSGRRGDGKSTLLFHIFNSFSKFGFHQKKNQVYAQKDVIRLLAEQQFGYCWDDEAINSGYKRDFQKTGQKNMIKVITNYRDNFNIYGSAVPFFNSLDKDLRELMFMHIHIVERGLAVIFLSLSDQVHSSDPWDIKNNEKIEQKELARIKKNPNLRFRYHRFTTFAGYLYFGPMTKKQEEIYVQIKQEKRAKSFQDSGILQEEIQPFKQRLYNMLMQGKLTKNGLSQACLLEGEKYTSIVDSLNSMLKDAGEMKKTVSSLLQEDYVDPAKEKTQQAINDLIPSF